MSPPPRRVVKNPINSPGSRDLEECNQRSLDLEAQGAGATSESFARDLKNAVKQLVHDAYWYVKLQLMLRRAQKLRAKNKYGFGGGDVTDDLETSRKVDACKTHESLQRVHVVSASWLDTCVRGGVCADEQPFLLLRRPPRAPPAPAPPAAPCGSSCPSAR